MIKSIDPLWRIVTTLKTAYTIGAMPEQTNQNDIYKHHWHRYLILAIIVVLVLFAAILLQQCNSTNTNKKIKAAKPASKPIPVVTAIARRTNVPIYLSALGSVTAYNNVTVRTQINGLLIKVYFDEGQMVKKGELLAEIDPRPYQAQLIQFEGQLARDKALLANARIDLQRYKTLYPQGAVSKQVYETQISLVKQLEGTVKSGDGQIEAVKLNLLYCKIVAPISGKIGFYLVDEGNFVQTSDAAGIAVINTINPIDVTFPIAEDKLPQIVKQNRGSKHGLIAKAYDRAQTMLLATGKLIAIDSAIDSSTGTIRMKATFDNKENNLFPNQFVNIQLLVDTLRNVTVVPTAAIQHGTQGTFVYVLNNNYTVSLKPVKVGITSGQYTVIQEGVLPGYTVVTEGTDKLTDGAKVIAPGKEPETTKTPQELFTQEKSNKVAKNNEVKRTLRATEEKKSEIILVRV